MHPFDDRLNVALPPAHSNDMIWHYTSLAGALGILSTNTLHLGSARMLNDTGELDYGLTFIQRRLEALITADRRFAAFAKQLRWIVEGAAADDEEIFVGCASTQADSLSQFRGYGVYAICANAGMALRTANSVDEDYSMVTAIDEFVSEWRPVIYETKRAHQHVDRVLDALLVQCREWPTDDDDAEMIESLLASARVTACAAFLKHPAFSDEHEVRIIASADLRSTSVGVKAGRLGMTPYVAVRAKTQGQTFIHDVRVGPGIPDEPTALYGLKRTLDKFGFNNITPTAVSIPYR